MKFQNILIFILILSACTSAPAQPNLAKTVEATSTLTPANTPLPTETPSPTIDPNAPLEYSRFEDGIYFLDETTKNGNTLTYTWNKERQVWERPYFYGPIWPRYPEQIQKGAHHQLIMTVTIDKALEANDLPMKIIPHENTDSSGTLNWSSFFFDIITSKMKNAGMFPNPNKFDMTSWFDGSHKFHFDFKNTEGQQQWGLWEGSTVDVRIRSDYEALKAEMGKNGFSEAKGKPNYGEAISYMVRMWTENGNLYVDIAPTHMPTNEKQIMEILMFGPAAVMENATYLKDPMNAEEVSNLPDLSEPQSGQTVGFFVSNQKSFRLFDIEPPK